MMYSPTSAFQLGRVHFIIQQNHVRMCVCLQPYIRTFQWLHEFHAELRILNELNMKLPKLSSTSCLWSVHIRDTEYVYFIVTCGLYVTNIIQLMSLILIFGTCTSSYKKYFVLNLPMTKFAIPFTVWYRWSYPPPSLDCQILSTYRYSEFCNSPNNTKREIVD